MKRTLSITPSLFLLAAVATLQTIGFQAAWADKPDPSALDRWLTFSDRTSGKIYRDAVSPVWIAPHNDAFWYRVRTGNQSHEFVLVNCIEGTRQAFIDRDQLRAAIDEQTGQSTAGDGGEGLSPRPRIARSGNNGQPTSIEFDNRTRDPLKIFWVTGDGARRPYGQVDGNAITTLSTYGGHAWLLVGSDDQPVASFVASELETRAVINAETQHPKQANREPERRRDSGDSSASPDDRYRVSITKDDGNAKLTGPDGEVVSITDDAVPDDGYSGIVHWSPDSSHFVLMKTKWGTRREINIVASSPDDSQHGRLITVPYAKPGDDVDHPRPVLFSVDGSPPQMIDDKHFPNPYALTQMRWHPDGRSFSFLYNQRGHQVLRLIRVDAETAAVDVPIEENSDTFVCYSQKTFLQRLPETNEFIWMSERSGWNHVYLVDGATGSFQNISRTALDNDGRWVVREVERVDVKNRRIWLQIAGIHAGEDPYHAHLMRVEFDGSDATLLTSGDGHHHWTFSPDDRWLIDHHSRVDLPMRSVLRDAETGRKICDLETAQIGDLLATGWRVPERFVSKARDGETDIHGIIVRPTNFDSRRRYPVLEAIYAGPHSAFVPKRFQTHAGLYRMAELGFIVVKIDGMGTNHRSKAFHDVCWQNLGDSGFPDRIAWMKAAAETRPEMDISRVGIWGGSAGGQSAMRALIAHGDFYDAAVADCGCHDNRVDKIWWNEQWMGWPIGDHYAQQSNVTQAHRMSGDLMLIVGELDQNVDPISTMQVVDALIKADKDFELLVMPGIGHGAASHPYAARRQAEFFLRKLQP